MQPYILEKPALQYKGVIHLRAYETNRIVSDLRARCKESGLTITKLATLAGFHESRVSAYFTGVTLPRVDAVFKLAGFLGMAAEIRKASNNKCIAKDITNIDQLYAVISDYRKSKKILFKHIEAKTGRKLCYYASTLQKKRSMRLDILVDLLEALGLKFVFKVNKEVG